MTSCCCLSGTDEATEVSPRNVSSASVTIDSCYDPEDVTSAVVQQQPQQLDDEPRQETWTINGRGYTQEDITVGGKNSDDGRGTRSCCCCPRPGSWRFWFGTESLPCSSSSMSLSSSVSHFLSTLFILVITYSVAITVPGVALVWSIVGSSMAVWIAFVVPTMCFLRIRQHKGLTMQALYAWMLLFAALIAMVLCTQQAIANAIAASSSLST